MDESPGQGQRAGDNASAGLPDTRAGQQNVLIVLAGLIALAALAIAGYLSAQSLSGNAVAGCGGDAGCGAVLASPWSKVGPVPVSLLGAAAYLAVLVGLGMRIGSKGKSRAAEALLLAASSAMLCAAGWFTYVQAAEIGAWCRYCMADHGLGVALALLLLSVLLRKPAADPIRPIALGIMGVGLIITVQTLAPSADTRSTENFFPDRDGDTTVDGKRYVSMFGGELQFVLQDVPYHGRADTDHVVGVVFDYACPHCRALHRLLDEALEEDHNRFAYVPLPITIGEAYNPYLRSDNARFDDSDVRAELSLAVAAIDLEKWRAYDRWLFAMDSTVGFPRSAEDARAKAIELVGEAALDEQLTGEALMAHQATIKRNIALLKQFPPQQLAIPIVTTPGAPRHLTERFYDIAELNLLLNESAEALREDGAGQESR